MELHLRNGSAHDYSSADSDHYGISAFSARDISVPLTDGTARHPSDPSNGERSLRSLFSERGENARAAKVELHRRLAFPVACLAFALIAVPLGSRPRRGGRSAGFLTAVGLVSAYYLIFTVGAGFARQGSIPAWLGIWGANLITVIAGLALIPQMGRMRDDSRIAHTFSSLTHWRPSRAPSDSNNGAGTQAAGTDLVALPANGNRRASTARTLSNTLTAGRTGGKFPQFLDFYLLRNSIYYFVLLTVGFVVLFEVFTFLELLNDIARHRTSSVDVVNYFRYLFYYLAYQLAPLACLVSVLITLGVMSKNNELVAFKAAGVSLYRIALPLIVIGVVFAGALLMFEETYLPFANQRQNELRNLIKGRPAQTYYTPSRQWIFGDSAGSVSKIYNYQVFDPDRSLLGGLNVFELDPQTFSLRRRVYASRAFWQPLQRAWILQSGWYRDFDGGRVTNYVPFKVSELDELSEPPAYFNREVRQGFQMNWWELERYIAKLRQSGFDVAGLSVQLQRKLAFPLIAPIIILLAIPFSMLVGTRGAVGGLTLGVGIAVVYWATSALFEAMGAIGQLPPILAAWSPDVIFLFLGFYFFLKMPT